MDPLEGLDSILTDLVKDARVVLGPNAMGIYLYGSAVSGGFDPGVSDLDLVVLTDAEVGSIDLAGLERMHADFVGRHPEWDDRIEVVYIGQATLRSFRTSPGSLAVISPGESFHVTGPVVDWDQNWYQVREYGVALFGTPAAEVIPLISRSEYIAAVARYAAWLGNQSLDTLSPCSLAYTVLSLCRALRTVQIGEPCSKQEGAAWTKKRMPDWTQVIDASLSCRLSRGTTGFEDEAMRLAARSFIRVLADQISHLAQA